LNLSGLSDYQVISLWLLSAFGLTAVLVLAAIGYGPYYFRIVHCIDDDLVICLGVRIEPLLIVCSPELPMPTNPLALRRAQSRVRLRIYPREPLPKQEDTSRAPGA
jgi:hypothetical protein